MSSEGTIEEQINEILTLLKPEKVKVIVKEQSPSYCGAFCGNENCPSHQATMLFSIYAGSYDRTYQFCKFCGCKLDLQDVEKKSEELKTVNVVRIESEKDKELTKLREKFGDLTVKYNTLRRYMRESKEKKKIWKDVLGRR